MATPQLSPGVITREVDLTVGRADNVLANVGAIAGPFSIGPVGQAIDITTEQDLINTFGKPISTDTQYEYWMSASSFLSYGGVLKVVRADGATLNNANAGAGAASTTSAKVKNFDDYNANWSSDSVSFTYAAKNPGTWGNNLKVCFIDDLADQVIGIATTNPLALGAQVGYGVTTALNGSLSGVGTVSSESEPWCWTGLSPRRQRLAITPASTSGMTSPRFRPCSAPSGLRPSGPIEPSWPTWRSKLSLTTTATTSLVGISWVTFRVMRPTKVSGA